MKGEVLVFHNIITRNRALQETMRPPGLSEDDAGTSVVIPGGEDLCQLGHVDIFKISIDLEDGLCQNTQPGCHCRIWYLMSLSFTSVSAQGVS